MSERIIEALMQLFAVFARPDSDAENRRPVVEAFLKHQLNKELVEKFLVIFDKEYAEVQADVNRIKSKAKSKDQEKQRMRIISKLSTRILKICISINKELTQKQKIFVLVRLIEFVKSETDLTEVEITQEKEFIDTAAEQLNMDSIEYTAIYDFVNSSFGEIPFSQNLLIINNKEEFSHPEVKHIYSAALHGEIKVFNISSLNMQIFRSKGIGELNLNGQLIQEEQVNFLSIGSAIRSSKIKPIYYSEILSAYNVDKSKSRIVFETKDVVYKFKGGNVGLHKMNFREESGNLIGIMGASGAGKSTLLNVLNGSYIPTEGQVTINGINIHNDDEEKLKGLIGFVSQDDLLIEELTVFQNLYYNAKLCFDNYSEEEIIETVDNVLKSLGLFERKDMIVGNPLNKKISGGQRKRLNIALELIREPAILFLDEPTSGLSSKDSENIMDLLKELSLKGKLVFVVIHQPSSDIFKTFDKLIILDTGGYQIYYGDPVDSIIYFKERMHQADWNESECPTCGNVNPEQVFKIIEANVIDEYGNLTPTRKYMPEDWYEMYTVHQNQESEYEKEGNQYDIPAISFKIPNWFKQLKVFITRDVLSKLANLQYIMINALESPLIAAFLAYIIKFYSVDVNNELGYIISDNDNLPVYIFMLVICAIFIGLTVSAEEIISDRRILKRESFLNLSRSSYLISKVTILLVISAIQSLVFILIGNTILEIEGMYFHYWLVAFSTWSFANMLGLNISDSFKTAVTIYILIPFLVIPQIILSGIIVKFDKLNPDISNPKSIPFYGEIMTSRWAYEALSVYQFKNNAYEYQFYPFEKVMSQSDYKKNYWIRTLENKINFCERNLNDTSRTEKIISDLQVLRHEISKESRLNPKYGNFAKVDQITIEKISPELIADIREYLSTLKRWYIKLYNKASSEKDKIVSSLTQTPETRENFVMLKKRHHNENLSEFCRNSNDLERIVEYDGELIQKIDPVFQDPDHSFIKSHFYAPRKQFFGQFVDTYWANVIVIWLMSLLLYITLYFEALKRLLDFMERLSDKFSNNE